MDQELLSGTFLDLADTMVADFDVIDFLHLSGPLPVHGAVDDVGGNVAQLAVFPLRDG